MSCRSVNPDGAVVWLAPPVNWPAAKYSSELADVAASDTAGEFALDVLSPAPATASMGSPETSTPPGRDECSIIEAMIEKRYDRAH